MDSWGWQSPQLLHPAPGPPGWVTPSSCQWSREASQTARSAWKSVEQGGQDLRQELLCTCVSTVGKSKSCSKVMSSNIVLSSSVLKEEAQAYMSYICQNKPVLKGQQDDKTHHQERKPSRYNYTINTVIHCLPHGLHSHMFKNSIIYLLYHHEVFKRRLFLPQCAWAMNKHSGSCSHLPIPLKMFWQSGRGDREGQPAKEGGSTQPSLQMF